MNEGKQKKKLYNQEAISVLKEKYGFKENYIAKSIRGDRTGIIPSQIKKEYEQLENAAKKAVAEKAQQQLKA